jgi:acetolactate decarboxylase
MCIRDRSTIGDQVKEAARQHQVHTDEPFPFLIKGNADDLQYHVLNKTDDQPPNGTTEQHDKAKVKFTLTDQPVEILGFYSEHHQGIFTHHSSPVHVHVKTADGKASGHIEDLSLKPGAIIFLPAS